MLKLCYRTRAVWKEWGQVGQKYAGPGAFFLENNVLILDIETILRQFDQQRAQLAAFLILWNRKRLKFSTTVNFINPLQQSVAKLQFILSLSHLKNTIHFNAWRRYYLLPLQSCNLILSREGSRQITANYARVEANKHIYCR